MLRYSLTILISAALLFMIQPLLARRLLPELGGTATIWTTCMMFFQTALFGGYLYAHLLRTKVSPRSGWLIHCGLVATALFWLVFQPFADLEFETGELSWAITKKLFLIIGIPFVILSATSPLLQAWHSCSHPDGQTYRLYALSNLGSLLALLAYPFIFDPWIGVSTQYYYWSIGYFVFSVLTVASGFQLTRATSWSIAGGVRENERFNRAANFNSVVLWVVLAANGSLLLVATSNILCQEVASFPFLWVMPLVIYLLTLIICFDWPLVYQRWVVQPCFAVSCFFAIIIYHFGSNLSLLGQTIGCCTTLFFGCMICHGELVRLKPGYDRLTSFYLAIAFGGAVGSIVAVVLAPRIFNRFFEFHFALLFAALLALFVFCREYFQNSRSSPRRFYFVLLVNGLAIVPIVSSLCFNFDPTMNKGILFQGRNDYGLVSVKETKRYRIMNSGNTNHGGQLLDQQQESLPFVYYGNGSGAQLAFEGGRLRTSRMQREFSVGVIGLGTGSMLSYGRAGDAFRFYEINPMVLSVAKKYFDYLPAENATIVLGDGRLNLRREFEKTGSHQFDLLFLDAFTSDSIPVHLLTRECFDLYLRHLREDGIIVAHITNKFVDLKPVVASIANRMKLSSARVEHTNEEFEVNTEWILLSRDRGVLEGIESAKLQLNWIDGVSQLEWTDENASVLPIVKWWK